MLYLAILSQPLNAVTNLVLQYKKATASAQRVFEILDEKGEDQDRDLPPVTISSGSITFKHVTFSYLTSKTILRNLSFHINDGETIALVGPSGSGKTSLVNLISRLFAPDSGTICLDGKDIASIPLETLRNHIGYVTQETILFPGSIRENIRYGNIDCSESDIVTASKAAHAHGFIMKLQKKYSTKIGERGAKLSGGQKQRIALARVLIKKPSILVLDEATSSLDTVSEQHVQDALKKILHRQTTILIAHRLSTVLLADRIFVLDSGRIVESGTHAELLKKKNSLYSQLWYNNNLLN